MRLLLSNNKHVGTKIGWKHGTNSNQLYRPEASLTGGEASPADTKRYSAASSLFHLYFANLDLHHPPRLVPPNVSMKVVSVASSNQRVTQSQ
jgi:hypothetical protein